MEATSNLGSGTNALKIDLKESEDDFVVQAWEHLMTQTWKKPDGGAVHRRKALLRALHIIAESRSSLKQKAFDPSAELTRESSSLEAPFDMKGEMLIKICGIRIVASWLQYIENGDVVKRNFSHLTRIFSYIEAWGGTVGLG